MRGCRLAEGAYAETLKEDADPQSAQPTRRPTKTPKKESKKEDEGDRSLLPPQRQLRSIKGKQTLQALHGVRKRFASKPKGVRTWDADDMAELWRIGTSLLLAEGAAAGATGSLCSIAKAGLAVRPCISKGFTTNHTPEAQSTRSYAQAGHATDWEDKLTKICAGLRKFNEVNGHGNPSPTYLMLDGFPLGRCVSEMRARRKHQSPVGHFHTRSALTWQLTQAEIAQLTEWGMGWKGAGRGVRLAMVRV